MKKAIAILTILVLAVVVYSCKKSSTGAQDVKAVSLVLPATPDNYFPNNGFGNNDSINRVATLGRVLFYDTHLSVNNAISCGSCHKQALGFADNSSFSTGYQGMLTKRNSPALNDLQFKEFLFWDGRENNISNLPLRPMTNHVEMGITDLSALPQKLAALPYYTQLFNNAFGTNQGITADQISGAIGLFISAITSGNSRLDQYLAGNTSALTAQEIYGKSLFDTKYNCAGCHISNGGGGYSGTEAGFKDIGLDNAYTDMGRGTITGLATDNGTFRVPDLTNVGITAPYMHDGRYQTLGDVIDHYSHNIMNSPNLDPLLRDNTGKAIQMNISDQEKAAIVAFLNTLTDFNIITDPKFSTPFKVIN